MNIVQELVRELARAEEKHPFWPNDLIHQVAIIQEEVGEAMREALNIMYQTDGDMDKLKQELVQSGAMVLRMLKNLC